MCSRLYVIFLRLTKKGDLDNLQVDGELTTPFSDDLTINVKNINNLPESLQTVVGAQYGDDFKVIIFALFCQNLLVMHGTDELSLLT